MLKEPQSPRPGAVPIPTNANDGQVVFVQPSRRRLLNASASSRSSNIVPTTANAPSAKATGWRRVVPGKRAYLSYLTIGVIYGDIGTSPLYTFSSVFTSPPESENQVLGALSLMLYSILLVFILKYVVFMLFADDHGEGGTFALFSLLSRSLKAKGEYPKWNRVFSTLSVLGVSAIIADGVLTPAITVLGAVQGLLVAAPGVLTTDDVAGISCAILFCFFMLQSLGTHKLAFLFSPILTLWFLSLAGIGLYNITLAPRILAAFNPQYAVEFLGQGFEPGWASLGAVFLTLTGSEALFADVGHFSVLAVRTSALTIVLPSLLLCYLGQGATILVDPTIVSNTFYLSTPKPLFYPMLVLATLAAIIASQAMVTATFSILAQAINLEYFPKMTIKRSNASYVGAVYIPEINVLLMVAVLVVVGGFRSSTTLGYAYGITVSSAFLISTLLYSACIVLWFERHWLWALGFGLVFGFVDGNFLAANLLKFTTGGWFSVVLMVGLSLVLFVWRWGKTRTTQEQAKTKVQLANLTVPMQTMDSELLVCMSGVGNQDTAPASLVHFLHRVPCRPTHLVLLTVKTVNVGFVDAEFVLSPIPGIDKMYHMAVYHGYAEDPPKLEALLGRMIQELCLPQELVQFPPVPDSELVAKIDPTVLVGRDVVVAKPDAGFGKRWLVFGFQLLLRGSRSPLANLRIQPDATLEIGLTVAI
ncbi:hypothetical protein BASA81_012638 [Batrachochytrium salamandrivorans]|nr:hypothetical protein BASA81_012638 [Batrachochytrium salamandrivorans]